MSCLTNYILKILINCGSMIHFVHNLIRMRYVLTHIVEEKERTSCHFQVFKREGLVFTCDNIVDGMRQSTKRKRNN